MGVLPIALAGLLVSGCASRRVVEDTPPAAPDLPAIGAQTAILPFANETNTVAAPEILRKLFFDEAAGRRYALQPLEETDRRLREQLQISDGGQLAAATPPELADALGVQTLFYGDVLEWKKMTTGVYNEITVRARFQLISADKDQPLWEKTHAVSKKRLAGSMDELVAGVVQNLLLSPMTPYARQLVKEIGPSLPPPPLQLPAAGETPKEDHERENQP
ncbi:MAG: hypothetical protein AB1515_06385 [Nitrospirota bacterium]